MMTGLDRLIGDLRGLRAYHAWVRDNVGQAGCKVRKAAAEHVATLDRALAMLCTIRADTIEQCARAAEAFDDPDRDWLSRSVWDGIKRDTARRIRALTKATSA